MDTRTDRKPVLESACREQSWEVIASWDKQAAELYWKRNPIQVWGQKPEDTEKAVRQLLSNNRARYALSLVSSLLHASSGKSVPIDRDLIVRALEKAVVPDEGQQAAVNSNFRFEVAQILDRLESDGLDEQILLRLEWIWLPALEHTERGMKSLHRSLADSPEFFVDILRLLFRADDEPPTEPDAQARYLARNAHTLLENWHRVPGFVEARPTDPLKSNEEPQTNDVVDKDKLCCWVTKTRELAASTKHLQPADREIGKVFAYAPSDPDGTWPCAAVRSILEGTNSDAMSASFVEGLFFKRGAYFAERGGGQDFREHDRFKALAEKLRSSSPKTAGLLDNVAASFQKSAQSQIEEEKLGDFEL